MKLYKIGDNLIVNKSQIVRIELTEDKVYVTTTDVESKSMFEFGSYHEAEVFFNELVGRMGVIIE